MSENEIESILNWLNRSGYPLEMRAARQLYLAQAETSVSVRYRDPIERTYREVDIVATWNIEASEGNGKRTKAKVTFVIECKSTGIPWVMFAYDRESNLEENYDESLVIHDLPNNLGEFETLSAAHAAYERLSLFSRFRHLGYAIAEKRDPEKGKGGRDAAYDGSRQAASAALGLLQATADVPHIFVPILLTNSPLYICSLDSDAALQITQTDSCAVMVDLDESLGSPVCVAQSDVLPALIQDVRQAISSYEGNIGVLTEAWEPKALSDFKPPSVSGRTTPPLIYVRRLIEAVNDVLDERREEKELHEVAGDEATPRDE
ncbi:hypothetical protein AAH991_31395 [Microbispora sp. ZYX-F-249]|uniref:DUF4365 domain-containing protein n=1 Tax=Microbispora maris TaxID=3144104 RepID=A0ABV0AWJ6_9ACTN